MKVYQSNKDVIIEDEQGHKIQVTTNSDGILVENLSKEPCQYQHRIDKSKFLFKGPDFTMSWKEFSLIIRG